MDDAALELAGTLISRSYAAQAGGALAKRRRTLKSLLSERRLPAHGWDEISIEQLLQEAAVMDSNNFPSNVGVGEREARVACPLVARRHFRLAHGVGRSGDIAAVQPKAAGSSLLAKLANLLAADALRIAGLEDVSAATVLPLATGMALACTLLAVKRQRPAARYVLWPRIDQKTCAKCVTAAGLQLVVIPNRLEGDELRTDMQAIRDHIARLGADSIAAVLTTTSCFAPRGADRLVEVAKLCQEADIPHVINHAYGVQARQLCRLVTSAWRKGRVDAVVQSTDKNFMVPVGGSLVAAGPRKADIVTAINAAYPGRASASPMLDLLMTLLHWGADGWRSVLQERENLHGVAKRKLQAFCSRHAGCRLLKTPNNPISLALTLDGLQQAGSEAADGAEAASSSRAAQCAAAASGEDAEQLAEAVARLDAISGQPFIASQATGRAALSATFLGSMLFNRCVSGTRVVARGKRQTVERISFEGYGAHHDAYPHDYLTVAVALGTTEQDIDEFLVRLDDCLREFARKQRKASAT